MREDVVLKNSNEDSIVLTNIITEASMDSRH